MASYSYVGKLYDKTNASAHWAVLSPANNEAAVMEISITATAFGSWAIGRSANTPTLRLPESFIADDESARPLLSLTKCSREFTVNPTVPTQFFRRFSFSGASGTGICYTFPRGIVLPAAGVALVLWGISGTFITNSMDLSCVIEE